MRTQIKYLKFLSILVLLLLLGNTLQANNTGVHNYHAIVIAIDDYNTSTWASLKTPVNDANLLKNVLEDKYGFSNVTTIYNKSATRSNIISTIENKVGELGQNDNLLIYFSGNTKNMGSEVYWIPSDVKTDQVHELVPTNEVKNIISRAASKHILVMVDGLFNNTLMKSVDEAIQNDGSENYYAQIDEVLSRQILISGANKPTVKQKDDNSVFTKCLLKYLDNNQKKVFDVAELYTYLKYPVTANTPNSPVFGHIQNAGHEGGQFIFRLQNGSLNNARKLCDSPVSIEEGELITFNEDGGTLHAKTDLQNVQYEWSFNSQILNHNESNLKVNESGMYSVTIISGNGDCATSTLTEVEVKFPELNIDILQGEEVVFKEKGTLNVAVAQYKDNLIFEWRKGNFKLGTGQSIDVTESGNYTVVVKHSSGKELGRQQTSVTVEYKRYVVESGDNMEAIAQKFYSNSSAAYIIYDANPNINKDDELKVGSEILIPSIAKLNKDKSSFSIGTTKDFAPLAGTNAYNGGMLTDIVRTVYKEMDQEIDIQYFSGDKIKGVYTGITDMSFPFTKNKNDNALYIYSDPIYTTGTVIFMNTSDATPEMKKLETVIEIWKKEKKGEKIKIALPVNFMCDALLEYSSKKYIELTTYSSTSECLIALKNNEVNLVAVPQIVGLVTIQNVSELNRLDFKILKKPIESTSLHLVVSKDHPEAQTLINDFNASFSNAQDAGQIQDIIATHISHIQKNRGN